MDDEIDVMSILEDEDVILPGQFDYDIKESLEKITATLERMDSDAKKNAKKSDRNSAVEIIIALIAALASVVQLFFGRFL